MKNPKLKLVAILLGLMALSFAALTGCGFFDKLDKGLAKAEEVTARIGRVRALAKEIRLVVLDDQQLRTLPNAEELIEFPDGGGKPRPKVTDPAITVAGGGATTPRLTVKTVDQINPADGGTWTTPAAPLYAAGGPKIDQCDQVGLADCYLIAVGSSLAWADAPELQRQIVRLPDGRVRATYFESLGGVPFRRDVVTSYQLPSRIANRNIATWGGFLEKTYTLSSSSSTNTYSSIGSGGSPSVVFRRLGYDVAQRSASNVDIGTSIAAATAAGAPQVANTKNPLPVGVTVPAGIVKWHVYHVLDHDPVRKTVRVRNPWETGGTAGDGVITITTKEFQTLFSIWTSAPKRNAAFPLP